MPNRRNLKKDRFFMLQKRITFNLSLQVVCFFKEGCKVEITDASQRAIMRLLLALYSRYIAIIQTCFRGRLRNSLTVSESFGYRVLPMYPSLLPGTAQYRKSISREIYEGA